MNNRVWLNRAQQFFETHSRFIIVVLVLLALVILGSVASPYFRSSRNLLNFGRKMVVVLTMLSIGQTIVMIAGGIDLSIGAMVKLMSSSPTIPSTQETTVRQIRHHSDLECTHGKR